MNQQYTQISVYKCIKCGAILRTMGGGAERHKERCKFTPPVLDGQIDMIQDAAHTAQGDFV